MGKWLELIAIRQQRHLSQMEAAEAINVGTRTYQQWELGLKRPQPRNWRELLKVFPELDPSGTYRAACVERQGEGDQPGNASASDGMKGETKGAPEQATQPAAKEEPALPLSSPMPGLPVDAFVSALPEEIVTAAVPGETEGTELAETLWTLAFLDHLTLVEKQEQVRQAIKEFDAMHTEKNDQMTRREAMRSLAHLPLVTLGLSVPGNHIQPKRYGDALAYCTVALEGCWQLYRGGDASDLFQVFRWVSKYVSVLKAIAQDAAVYRDEALALACKYTLLQTLLGWGCVGTSETLLYAKDAVALSKKTGDISLLLSAYIKQAWSYFYAQKYVLARTTMLEGEAALREYQGVKGMPPISPSIIGGFYSAYALVQAKNNESPDTALGIATNSEVSKDSVAFVVFTSSTQWAEAAEICCYKGDQEQAMMWLGKGINVDTLVPLTQQSPKGYLDRINILTLAMLKSRDQEMDKIIHHWTVAAEKARELQNELAFGKVLANFELMEAVFPGEKAIAKLRPLTVHWNADMG